MILYDKILELISNNLLIFNDDNIAKIIAITQDFDKLEYANKLLDILSINIVIEPTKSYTLNINDKTYIYPVFDLINKTNYETILTDENINAFAEYVIISHFNKKNNSIERIFMEIMNTEIYIKVIESIINSKNTTDKIFDDILLSYIFHITQYIVDKPFDFSRKFNENIINFFHKTNEKFVKKIDFTNDHNERNIILSILSADNNNMQFVINNCILKNTDTKYIIGYLYSINYIYEYCIKTNNIDSVKESLQQLSKNMTDFIIKHNLNILLEATHGQSTNDLTLWTMYKMLDVDNPTYLNENPFFEETIKQLLENIEINPISIYGTTLDNITKSLKFISKSNINSKSSPILQYFKLYEGKKEELCLIKSNICASIYNLVFCNSPTVTFEEIIKHLKLDNDILFSKLEFHIYFLSTFNFTIINETHIKNVIIKIFSQMEPINQDVYNHINNESMQKYMIKIRDFSYHVYYRRYVISTDSKDLINLMFVNGLIPSNITNKQTLISQSIFSIDIDKLISDNIILYDDFCTIQSIMELIEYRKIKSVINSDVFKTYLDTHIMHIFNDPSIRRSIINKSKSEIFIDLYELGYLTDSILSIKYNETTIFEQIVREKCPELLERIKNDNLAIISKHLKSIIKLKKISNIIDIINNDILKKSELETFEALFLAVAEFDKIYLHDFLIFFSKKEDVKQELMEILKKYPDRYLDYTKFDINKLIDLIVANDLLKYIDNSKIVNCIIKNNVRIENITNLLNSGLELTYELYKNYPQLIYIEEYSHKYINEILNEILESETIYTKLMSYEKKTFNTLTIILLLLSEKDEQLFFDTIINYDIDSKFFTENKDKIMDKIIYGMSENAELLVKMINYKFIDDRLETICKLKNKIDNYTLSYVTDKTILCKYISHYKIKMFEQKNTHGNPRLMSFLENKSTFDVIISEFNPKELEHIRDRFNNNIYTYIIKYNINCIIPPYAYIEINSSGKNTLMQFCEIDLINEKLIDIFLNKHKNIIWNRIFIDEADTIKIKNIELPAKFIWLITGTPSGIACSKKQYLNEIFGEYKKWICDFITIKNSNSFIDESIKLPTPFKVNIPCHTPMELSALIGFIPNNVVSMINAGNINDAVKFLNCNKGTSESIFTIVTKNILIAIKNKQIELKALREKKYTGKDFEENQKNIKKTENIIDRLKNRFDSVKKKFEDVKDELCSVCMGEINNQTVLDCCNSFYCFECITLFSAQKHKCPTCMKKITIKNIHVLNNNENTKDDSKEKLLDKIDQLKNILEMASNDKIKTLVFADCCLRA
jgi:hypothetical protein